MSKRKHSQKLENQKSSESSLHFKIFGELECERLRLFSSDLQQSPVLEDANEEEHQLSYSINLSHISRIEQKVIGFCDCRAGKSIGDKSICDVRAS